MQVEQAGERIRFSVLDSGPGVAPNQVARLFGAFEQEDTSTTRRFGGTGLGLTIVRHLAGLMDGEAGYTPRPAGGSRFHFEARLPPTVLPLAAEAVGEAASSARPGRILLAEDNEVNRMIAVTLLRLEGHQVEVVGDGRAAVTAALAGGHDLVLMDCQMPELDGFEATREIRRRLGPEACLPIIALTAGALAEDRERCFAAGMDDHLAKPFEPAELAAKLARWMPAATPPASTRQTG